MINSPICGSVLLYLREVDSSLIQVWQTVCQTSGTNFFSMSHIFLSDNHPKHNTKVREREFLERKQMKMTWLRIFKGTHLGHVRRDAEQHEPSSTQVKSISKERWKMSRNVYNAAQTCYIGFLLWCLWISELYYAYRTPQKGFPLRADSVCHLSQIVHKTNGVFSSSAASFYCHLLCAGNRRVPHKRLITNFIHI